MKQIKHGFRLLDIFGTPVELNFDDQSFYRSFGGGFCTFSLVAIIILSFQSQIRVFVSKQNIFQESKADLYSDPLLLRITTSDFMFALRIEQTVSYTTRPYFTIQVSQVNVSRSNGERIKSITPIEMLPCTNESFSDLRPEQLSQLIIEEYMCPTQSTLMQMQGTFLSKEFLYLQIEVDYCGEGYTNQLWNVSCATQEEREAYYLENGSFKLSIYTTNYVVNPTAQEDYAQLFLSDELSFAFQPETRKEVNVFFKEYEVNTDESLWPVDAYKNEKLVCRQEGSVRIDTINQIPNSRSPISVYFRSDFMRERSDRRYQKADQLIAYFGGIFHMCLLCVGFFVKKWNKLQFKMVIANKLYQFTDQRTRRTNFFFSHNNFMKQLENTIQEQKPNISVVNQQRSDSESIQNNNSNKTLIPPSNLSSSNLQSTIMDKLYRYFKEAILKQSEISAGVSYILFVLSCRKRFMSDNNFLIDSSIEQIRKDMDVRNILKLVHEVEKIKHIILTQSQLRLFNFSQKPLITSYNVRRKLQTEGRRHNISRRHHRFKQLVKAYSDLTQTPSNPQNSFGEFLTCNLLKSLGLEMSRILSNGIALMKNPQFRFEMLETENQLDMP